MIKTENISKSKAARKFFFAIFGVLFFAFAASYAQAVTISVTTLTDCTSCGSLRDAITQSNASVNVFDEINFTTGAGTINLITPLPAITDPVIINGGTTPTIELNGAATQGAGNASIGLYLRAGASTIQGFIINRFGEAGIRMDTDGVGNDNGNLIQGNRIGTDTTGNSATCGIALCGNINRGILIVGTTGHQIGGGTAAQRNIISGNQGNGIEISAGGNSTIINNYIGTSTAGTADLGNSQHGILIANSSSSRIGDSASLRNVISGNNGSGVSILTDFGFTASSNLVQNNYIGVDASGNTALRNDGSGVLIQAGGNTVGGATAADRNVISGNGANGVSVSTTLATSNFIQGNYLGVGADGTTAVGNRNNGVQISGTAADNTIGGTNTTPGACDNSCNVIANNGDTLSQTARAGVYVDTTGGTGNRIRGNSIFMNAGLGIDLGIVGRTPNDAGDPDTGATGFGSTSPQSNNLQNFPIIASAQNTGAVGGSLNSTPNTTFVIDFYRNAVPDTAATSEARIYIGSINVTTNETGDASFSFNSTQTLSVGQFITATATRTVAPLDTSEISDARLVIAPPGTAAGGIEADVDPRTEGNQIVESGDIIQMRRFVNRADTPNAATNEFQRADSAPYIPSTGTYGNGVIDAEDIIQTRRYANRADPPQPAAGPNASPTPPTTTSARSIAAGKDAERWTTNQAQAPPRRLVVQNAAGSAGNTVTVSILVDAVGDEAQYNFTVNFNTSVLTLDGTTLTATATGNAGGVRDCDQPTASELACGVGNFPVDNPASNNTGIGEIAPGDRQVLLTIRFRINANATPNSTTPLTFSFVSVADDNPATTTTIAPSDQVAGMVSITGATAAEASIKGRVKNTAGAGIGGVEVSVLDAASGRIQTTQTTTDGAYRFEGLQVGGDYIVTAKAAGYSFSPASRHMSLTEDAAEEDFIGTAAKKKRLRVNF